MGCGAMIRLEPGDQAGQSSCTPRPGGTCRVYPAPAGPSGGEGVVSNDHGHTIARETCVYRQACKHAEHAAWSDMKPQGARE